MKAVRVHQNGGSEVLKYEDVPLPEPKEGEVRLKIEAVGLNYIDIYQREGLYPLSLPFILGMEGAGLIDAVGARVKEFKETMEFSELYDYKKMCTCFSCRLYSRD